MVGDIDHLETSWVHRWQRYGWKWQVATWLAMAAVVVLSAAGILSPGPLGRVQVEGAEGSTLSYFRFVHRNAPVTVQLDVPVGQQASGVDVVLSQSYASAVRVEQASPRPTAVSSASSGLRYRFEAAGAARVQIRLHLTVDDAGRFGGMVTINGQPSLPIRQFAYP